MNGLHDLLDKLKRLEEAAVAPTQFKANYYHKNNFGGIKPLMMTDPGVFWHMASATNDAGGAVRGGGQTIQQWYGNTESRDALSPASVDGKMINDKPGPEFPPGTTWRTDLANLAQTQSSIAATKASLAAPNKEYDAAVASLKNPFAGAKLPTTAGATPASSTVAEPAPAAVAPVQAASAGDAGVVNNNTSSYNQTNNGQQLQQAIPAADDRVAKIKQLSDLLTKFPTLKESLLFKSRIGRALLESFDLGITEDPEVAVAPNIDQTNSSVVSAITALSKADATKQINDLITYFKDPKFNNDVEVQDLITKAIATVNTTLGLAPGVAADNSGAPPAAVASTTSTPEKPVAPEKILTPKDSKVQSFQDEVRKLDPKSFPKFGPDGRMGAETKGEIAKHPDIAAKYGLEVPALQSSQQKAPLKSVTQVSPDAQNMAGTKSTLKPDEIKAAQEALKDTSISARDKAYYTELLKNQPASVTSDVADQARPGLDPKKGKPEVWDRQKQLADLGAKGKDGQILKTDGVKGADTNTAEKEFGYMIIDPKTMVKINDISAPSIITPQGIKNAQTWIKTIKAGTQKMEQVPPVYADIVKKALSIKESTGYTNDELSRIVSLVHHR